jgi:hypothetical protein
MLKQAIKFHKDPTSAPLGLTYNGPQEQQSQSYKNPYTPHNSALATSSIWEQNKKVSAIVLL